MLPLAVRTFETPAENDLGLRLITNLSGMSLSVLPNGCIFAIEHRHERGRTLINQVQGSPLDGGIARLYLRVRAPEPTVAEAVGPSAKISFGATADRFTWSGTAGNVRYQVSLWLHPQHRLWLWCVEVANAGAEAVACDAILVQDVGLGDRGFLMNNEAYASQYIDHHIARHSRCGSVVMSRQNLAQSGSHPWLAHGCFDGAAGFATDALQLLGPPYRETGEIGRGLDLPSERLQHELACAMIQSEVVTLEPDRQAGWTFFGLYEPDHAGASSDADLSRIDAALQAWSDFSASEVMLSVPVRSLLQDAPLVVARPLTQADIARRYPERSHEERATDGCYRFSRRMACTTAMSSCATKERLMRRRHGTILRSGHGMLPDETTSRATCWMHGVFAAQLTIGNTSLHKLFSVSRDPYNITRASGLRILADRGEGWRLLAVPSPSKWASTTAAGSIASASTDVRRAGSRVRDDPAMHWRIVVEGKPCRFLVFGHLVLGERELEHAGPHRDRRAPKRFASVPIRTSLWGQRYPRSRSTSSSPHAGCRRGDRRRRAALCRWPARAAARMSAIADPHHERASLRRRRAR